MDWKVENELASGDGTPAGAGARDRARVRQAETFEALAREIRHARKKFPGNRFLLAALTEEIGELAQALLQKDEREQIRHEALQVACVALRIYEEGDAIFDVLTDEEAKP